MDNHPSWFVYNDQILVLKYDLQGNIFRDQDSWLGWGNPDLDLRFFLHHVTALSDCDAIYINTACFDQRLQTRAGKLRKLRYQEFIESVRFFLLIT